MAKEWRQENGRVRHSSALILLPYEKTHGLCSRFCVRVEGRVGVLTTEDAEASEESQKDPIVFFRVVRVFRGYLSRWLHTV
ncbi:MAG: hypothetical protein JNL58_00670 [Planctomyces sp.]|nr:hypothetical protein [Planctomyces sp.]